MSSNLPTTTLTFLFTDIEGSTQLWEKHSEAMRVALPKHDAILHEAIAANNGQIIKTTGDGMHAVFVTALDAIHATLAAQNQLEAPLAGLEIKVRMGLHTCEAEMRAGDYYGQAVNRAARIMSIGHGGQILLSAITAELVREHLPAQTTLHDLGEHRLKDLIRPEHIYQLNASNLPSEFPALKSLAAFPNNLPLQLTNFIGRSKEIAAAEQLFAATRLLTFVGPGGTGKTRLSLQVAAERLAEFKDGVWLVELASLATAEYVVPTLATTFGVRETTGIPLANLVIDYLRAKQLLLILDNCEHLIEFCARLADQLLLTCPALKLIASSREALGIAGETVFRVPPLSLPEKGPEEGLSAEALLACEAGRLFIERATKAEPRFQLTDDNAAAIAQICRRLDGIPLALELAAARVTLFTAEQIAERLDNRFKLLAGGSRTALPRQQTLRALIDWSYQILSTSEQNVLCQLAVFAGGCTFEAVEAVVGEVEALENLSGLINKSLINVEEQAGHSRYRFLETIRQYALEKLVESGRASEARNRHLDYFVAYAHHEEPFIYRPELPERLDQLEVEHDNLRAALEWAMENQPAKALKLAELLSGFWATRGYHREARTWCEKVLMRSEGIPALEKTRANVLGTVCLLATLEGNYQAGLAAAQAALSLARRIDDAKTSARSLHSLAYSALNLGDYATAATAAAESESIARKMGYAAELAFVLNTRAEVAYLENRDLVTARHYLEESLALVQGSGYQWIESLSLSSLARIAAAYGDIATARWRFEENANLGQRMGNRQIFYASRSELAHVLREHDELDEPLAIYKETILGWLEFGQRAAVAHELECMAFIFRRKGEARPAATLLAAAETLRQEIDASMTQLERAEYEREVAALRSQLEEESFTEAWLEGRTMTMDEAITLALNSGADD